MKRAGLIVGVMAVVIGLVWIGQGAGFFPYPASSLMINHPSWAYGGVVLSVAGIAAILISRRG